MTTSDPGAALGRIASELERLERPFAVVGGFGVSLRAEVRFTRDVDLAVQARDDDDVEKLVLELRAKRYDVIALVEHDEAKRLATVRLRDPSGITVDLLTASSGIETEIVDRATEIVIEGIGALPVAQAEELLAWRTRVEWTRRARARRFPTRIGLRDGRRRPDRAAQGWPHAARLQGRARRGLGDGRSRRRRGV